MANKRYDEFDAVTPVAGNILLVEDTALQTLGKFDVGLLLNNPSLIREEGGKIVIGDFTLDLDFQVYNITFLDTVLSGVYINSVNAIESDSRNFKHDNQASFLALANTTSVYTITFPTAMTSDEYSVTCNLSSPGTNLNFLDLKGIQSQSASNFKVVVKNSSGTNRPFVIIYQAIAYTP